MQLFSLRCFQPGVSDGAAIAFDVGIFLPLGRLDVLDPNAALLSNSAPLMYSGPLSEINNG